MLEAGALGLARPIQIGRLHPLQFFQRHPHLLGIAARQRIVDHLLDRRPAGVKLQGGIDMRIVGPAILAVVGIGLAGVTMPTSGLFTRSSWCRVGNDLRRVAGPADFARGAACWYLRGFTASTAGAACTARPNASPLTGARRSDPPRPLPLTTTP